MEDVIKARRATVVFFGDLIVDGYQMPDGSFRVGLSGASRVLGYSRAWLAGIVRGNSPKTLLALEGIGFTSNVEVIKSLSVKGNWFEDNTISLEDFQCCIIYGTQSNKKAAIALNRGFTKLALIDFFRDAFGEPPLTIKEKRELFYMEYAASISPEDWRRMDREEIITLALSGDEPHLQGGYWNK